MSLHCLPRTGWLLFFAATFASEARAESAAADTGADRSPEISAETRAEDGAEEAPDSAPAITAPAVVEFVAAKLPPGRELPETPVEVLLELTVGVDGSVSDVSVLQGTDAELDQAAVDAVARFRFSPAQRGDEAIAVRIRYQYVFEAVAPEPEEPEPTLDAMAEQDAMTTPAEGRSGALSGTVLQRGTRKPLIGAVVKLPDLGLETLTDAEGHFAFPALPEGKVRVRIEDAEHGVTEDTESVSADSRTEVKYYLEQQAFGEDDLVAVGTKPRKEVTRHEISVREVETVPGSNGDPLKAVQNMPGVARTIGDQIILRGGGQTRVFVNGLPLPAAFHFFGLRSTVGSGLLESLDVVPGNYSARYGRGNGGIVDITLRRPAEDGLHGFAQVDVFDASVFGEGPVSEHGTLALGVRRSYIDTLLPLVLDEEGKRTFQAAPRYYDMQAAYDWKSHRDRVRAVVLGSSDEMRLSVDPADTDPTLRGSLGYSQQFLSGQVLWDRQLDRDTSHSMAFSYLAGQSSQRVGRDLKLNLTAHTFAFRDEVARSVNSWLSFRSGIDAQLQYIDFDVVIPVPEKEGQVRSSLSVTPTRSAVGSVTNLNPALWAALDLRAGDWLFIPALRVDHFSRPDEFSGTAVVQPRFDTRWAVTEGTTLKAAVGFYSQPRDIDETNEVFGDPDAEPDLSLQYSVGVEQRLTDGVSLDVTGFYKSLYNLLSPVDDPEQLYDNEGKGRVYGSEVLLRHDLRQRFYGWLAYTLMRSERLDSGATSYRLYDTDQTHNLIAVGQYRLSPTWELGARFRYVTGNPTTPVVGATYDSDADTYAPVYGSLNSERLVSFHQLDVRVDKHFVFDTWKLTAYLDVQNVYNQRNPEATRYNYDYSESSTVAGLPLIPSFGVKGEF